MKSSLLALTLTLTLVVVFAFSIFFISLSQRERGGLLIPPDEEITESIVHGVESRFIYLDDYYSDAPADLNIFTKTKAKVITGYDSFTENKDKLFRSGLLVMRYGMRKKQLSTNDFKVVKKFIDNGGRVLLACPAWVYESYEKKKIKDLSFYKIAKEFGLVLTAEYADAPSDDGVFSAILVDNKKVAMARGAKGKAKIFVWGQNNFFDASNNALIIKTFDWLLER